MATRFTERAVASLIAYVEANYPTYLRAVETELGLNSGDLPNPADYVPADNIPFDNRNPRVDIFNEDMALKDHHERMMIADVECTIAWSYSSDADIEGGELLARRCLTAMIRCLFADRSLGGTVKACLFDIESAGSIVAIKEAEITRQAFQMPVVVTLQENL